MQGLVIGIVGSRRPVMGRAAHFENLRLTESRVEIGSKAREEPVNRPGRAANHYSALASPDSEESELLGCCCR